MIALVSLAAAAPGDLSLGGFLGAHLAGPEHELYAAPDAEHGSLGPSLPFGARVGVGIGGPIHLEGEGFVGPAAGVGAGLLYGVRLQAIGFGPVLAERFTPGFAVGFGNLGLSSLDLGNDIDLAAHLGPAVEVGLTDSLAVRGDLRWLLSGRQGAASTPGSHGELLVGIVWRKANIPDSDGDGIRDDVDACPNDAEYPNGYRDDDGCPDELATITVKLIDAEGKLLRETPVRAEGPGAPAGGALGKTNLEGRLTVAGLMPQTEITLVAEAAGLESNQATLTLAEGANDAEIVLGWAPGTVIVTAKTLGGVPVPAKVWALGPGQERWTLDAEGQSERVLRPGRWQVMIAEESYDAWSRQIELPAEAGPRTRVEAVLKPQRVQLTDRDIVTLDPILFQPGEATVSEASIDVVEAVAGTLVNHPEVERVEVRAWAHTGLNAKANTELSERRAEELVRLLVSFGVEAERLEASGQGDPGGAKKERPAVFLIRPGGGR